MVLVNGAEGIGTGWSCKLPNYNPEDIVNNLLRKMQGEEYEKMHPWYRGFKVCLTSYSCYQDCYRLSSRTIVSGDGRVIISPCKLGSKPNRSSLFQRRAGLLRNLKAHTK